MDVTAMVIDDEAQYLYAGVGEDDGSCAFAMHRFGGIK